MKVFKNKLTGRLGETQFRNDADVLILNAKAAGFNDNEIEIIDMQPDEYSEAIAIQSEDDKTPEQRREDKIQAEQKKILRETAIQNLTLRGEI